MVVVAKNKRLFYLLAYLNHQYSQYDKPRASLNTLLSQLATQHPSNKMFISKYNILLARERAVSRRRRHRSPDCACVVDTLHILDLNSLQQFIGY